MPRRIAWIRAVSGRSQLATTAFRGGHDPPWVAATKRVRRQRYAIVVIGRGWGPAAAV